MKNLKIGHISDVHLGYSSGKRINEDGTNLRVIDGYNAWKEAVEQMINEDLDIVVVSGDIFHMARPDIRTIMEAQAGLRKLAKAGMKVYVGAGNHDATDIRSEVPANGVLNEETNNIYSFVEPYIVKEVAPGYHFHFLNHHAYTDQGETMNSIELIKDEINVLVSHGSCFDTNMNLLLHCPQEPREVVIPEFVMNMDWDYTLLGHIHERGWIGSKDGLTDTAKRKQFYGGSVIRRGFTDRPCKLGRGWTKWEVSENKEFVPTFFKVNQRPQIDCTPIVATGLSAIEIEEKLVAQVKEIFEKYSTDNTFISNKNTPIVRQTLIGITPVSYVAINWSNCSTYTKHFLSYSLKRLEDKNYSPEENETNEIDKDNKLKQTKSIEDAFSEWMDTKDSNKEKIENKDMIIEKAKDWLRAGEGQVLESETK